ncbi:MAG: hypothetical protein OXU65_03330 [Deltaproteobacteria bacterium]|nr:hypothetical protein [Deltaproteobacteria bacterium]
MRNRRAFHWNFLLQQAEHPIGVQPHFHEPVVLRVRPDFYLSEVAVCSEHNLLCVSLPPASCHRIGDRNALADDIYSLFGIEDVEVFLDFCSSSLINAGGQNSPIVDFSRFERSLEKESPEYLRLCQFCRQIPHRLLQRLLGSVSVRLPVVAILGHGVKAGNQAGGDIAEPLQDGVRFETASRVEKHLPLPPGFHRVCPQLRIDDILLAGRVSCDLSSNDGGIVLLVGVACLFGD